MKIEIEFEEVEHLKEENLSKGLRIKELEDELKAMSPETLKLQAVGTAKELFRQYMNRVYKELGFEDSYTWDDPFRLSSGTLEHWLGEHWFESEKLIVTLGVNISNHWRKAFLSFNIKSEPDSKD